MRRGVRVVRGLRRAHLRARAKLAVVPGLAHPGAMNLRRVPLLLALPLVFALACGARQVPVMPYQQTLSSPGNQLVEAGVLQALARLRIYTVEQQSPGQIVALGTHRSRTWRVAITYGPGTVQVQHVDSRGLAFANGPQGPVISPHFERYMQRLLRTIDREVSRVAREGVDPSLVPPGTAATVAGTPAVTTPAGTTAPGGDQVVVLSPREACVNEVANAGHSEDMQSFCTDTLDPMCMASLLRMGHAPDQLPFCEGVDGGCAQGFLEAGGAPVDLTRCAVQ